MIAWTRFVAADSAEFVDDSDLVIEIKFVAAAVASEIGLVSVVVELTPAMVLPMSYLLLDVEHESGDRQHFVEVAAIVVFVVSVVA